MRESRPGVAFCMFHILEEVRVKRVESMVVPR